MKKQIILFTCYSWYGQSSYNNILSLAKFLREYSSDYEFILVTKNKLGSEKKHLEADIGIKISKVIPTGTKFITDCWEKTHSYDNWFDFISRNTWFDHTQFENLDKIIIIGGITNESAKFTRTINGLNDSLYKRHMMNFGSYGVLISTMLQLTKLSKETGAEVVEICYDPMEQSLAQLDYRPERVTSYFGLDIPNYNLIRFDGFQYDYLRKSFPLVQKDYDFVFGFSATAKSRRDIAKQIMENLSSSDRHKYFIKMSNQPDFEDRDDTVSKDKYLEYLNRSHFTLIIPSYDKNQFSIFRFIEALSCDCLPLITEDTNTETFVNSFDLDQSKVDALKIKYTDIRNVLFDQNLYNLLDYFKQNVLVTDKLINL